MNKIILEERPQSLLFSSLNRVRYLYDAATSSVHPWPWSADERIVSELYSASDEELPGLAMRFDALPGFVDYIKGWRRATGAFGGQLSHCDLVVCRDQSSDKLAIPASQLKPPDWSAAPSVFSNLILIITDACNLRCKYCIFSETYEDYQNDRSTRMSMETARKAVDRFLALNDTPPFLAIPNRKLDICFFGGEPLLEEELIKKIVSYASAIKKSHYSINFSLTTNLTYLPDSLAQFLVENQIEVDVSLDGPQPVHDQYRRDAADHASFEKVSRNLEKLQILDERFFAERVRAIVTLNGNSDLIAIRDFFESKLPMVPKIRYVGFIRDFQDGLFHQLYPYDQHHFMEQYLTLLQDYKNRKRRKVLIAEGDFLYHLFEEPLALLYKRVMEVNTPSRNFYTGTCIPGRRIAVSQDGQFHICERINHSFPIGNVERGFDLEACQVVSQKYYSSLPRCDQCWARSLCTACFASTCKFERFVFSNQKCDEMRKEIALRLSTLYSLLEDHADAFISGDPLIDRFRLAEGCSERKS